MKAGRKLTAAAILLGLGAVATAQDDHSNHDMLPQTLASQAYLEAMDRMHGPMMAGAIDPDPDIAFVAGMIPHHQGAVDMARIVLEHGRDETVKSWARGIIAAQESEIAAFRAWLAKRGK